MQLMEESAQHELRKWYRYPGGARAPRSLFSLIHAYLSPCFKPVVSYLCPVLRRHVFARQFTWGWDGIERGVAGTYNSQRYYSLIGRRLQPALILGRRLQPAPVVPNDYPC